MQFSLSPSEGHQCGAQGRLGFVWNGWHKENRLIEGQIVPSVWFNLYSPQTDPASN